MKKSTPVKMYTWKKLYLHEKIHIRGNVYVEKLYDFMQVCIFNFDIMLKYELIKSFIN